MSLPPDGPALTSKQPAAIFKVLRNDPPAGNRKSGWLPVPV